MSKCRSVVLTVGLKERKRICTNTKDMETNENSDDKSHESYLSRSLTSNRVKMVN